MRHAQLGPLLVARLAENQHLVDEMLTFVDVRISTVREWFTSAEKHRENPQYPRGEKLNRLWYFLAAAGVDSPELTRLPGYGAYLGKLMAYQVITLDEATQFCGLKNHQSALRVIQGEQQPTSPEATLQDLQELYDTELEGAVAALQERLQAKPAAPATEPASDLPPKRQEQPNPGVAERLDYIVDVARRMASLQVDVQHLLSTFTTEELATLRKYVNPYVLFDLANGLQRLSSTRAFNEGRN